MDTNKKNMRVVNVIVMVTTKGDVRDIETNNVDIVLSCNNYRIMNYKTNGFFRWNYFKLQLNIK
ncbi:hypothetical protein [Candidatus Hodgkinia cicadicola]|uniref:hypothetical protein n=1 Tax=Candidatus Hodgkinia cicadicola TaxID=573658 RepID=UPI0011BA95E7